MTDCAESRFRQVNHRGRFANDCANRLANHAAFSSHQLFLGFATRFAAAGVLKYANKLLLIKVHNSITSFVVDDATLGSWKASDFTGDSIGNSFSSTIRVVSLTESTLETAVLGFSFCL